MEESLEREFSRANRNKSSVAIVMMDLDHFKRFNDTFGHQAGDTLLRALGDLLKRSTRGQDIACRYGGEEFALVLTDSNLAGALQRAEILRQQVKQLSVEYAGQLLGTVSVSIGVALFPDHGHDDGGCSESFRPGSVLRETRGARPRIRVDCRGSGLIGRNSFLFVSSF